jgi:hypothetical protein
MTVSKRFWSYKNHKWSCNAERLGTFEPKRSNALEQIAENVYGTVTFTLQNFKIERSTVIYIQNLKFYLNKFMEFGYHFFLCDKSIQGIMVI